MNLNEIYTAIVSGDADEDLDRVMKAVGERIRTLGARNFDSLQEGDTVRIDTTQLRPRYLDGAIATIKEKRITKLILQFGDLPHKNDPYGKWSGRTCVLSPQHVVKIDA